MKCGVDSQPFCNENLVPQDFKSEILSVVMALQASQFLVFIHMWLFILTYSMEQSPS
jgi:hypothetical protein